MKFLGIQIANGFSSEARVFASLLGHKADAYEASVIHQQGPDDHESPATFAKEAQAPIKLLDFGWRLSPPGGHSPIAKAGQFLQLRASIPKALKIARAYEPDVIYSSQQHWDCYVATAVAQ